MREPDMTWGDHRRQDEANTVRSVCDHVESMPGLDPWEAGTIHLTRAFDSADVVDAAYESFDLATTLKEALRLARAWADEHDPETRTRR